MKVLGFPKSGYNKLYKLSVEVKRGPLSYFETRKKKEVAH